MAVLYTRSVSLFRRKKYAPSPPSPKSGAALWRVEQYAGQRVVAVEATQLDYEGLTASDRREILRSWVTFLEDAPTNIEDLTFVSRVPQRLLDSVSGQPQLRKLAVKWGPYRDLTVLHRLQSLDTLRLSGATAVESIAPIAQLPNLSSLAISQAHRVDAPPVLRTLTSLRTLSFGNASLGSDRSVELPDLQWVSHLRELRHLDLPGTRILDPDLSPILELPNLEMLGLPLRRAYRKQVFALAATSNVFGKLAADYEAYDVSSPHIETSERPSCGRQSIHLRGRGLGG